MALFKQDLTITFNEINKMSFNKWSNCFANIVEKSPEFAQKIWRSHSYSNIDELEQAYFEALDVLSTKDKIKIINRHKAVVQSLFHRFITFKADINSGSLIKYMDISEFEIKLRYESSFGFPFVLNPIKIKFEDFCLALRYRCNNTYDQEIEIAIQEIKKYVSEKLRVIIYTK